MHAVPGWWPLPPERHSSAASNSPRVSSNIEESGLAISWRRPGDLEGNVVRKLGSAAPEAASWRFVGRSYLCLHIARNF
jgi:hypothetical protein